MRDRLIELIKQAKKHARNTNCDIARNMIFADYLLANGVILPPCKVGDIVYEIQPIRKRIQAYKTTTAKYNGHYWWFDWVITDGNGVYGNLQGFSEHSIGKTVFLSQEAAERALKGGAE